MNTKILIILILLIINSAPCYSQESEFFNLEFSPGNIIAKSNELGIDFILNHISSSKRLYTTLQNKIKAGEQKWLDIFISLRQHPESNLGGHFDLFLAYALEHNPDGALLVIRKYQTENQDYFLENNLPSYPSLICGNVNEDLMLGCSETGSENGIAESAYRTLEKRLKSLEKNQNDNMAKEKADCIERILKAKTFWGRYCK